MIERVWQGASRSEAWRHVFTAPIPCHTIHYEEAWTAILTVVCC